MSTIDIIIVNYNSTNYTLKAIDNILTRTKGVVPNIIVVDNASSDQPERIARLHPGIKTLLLKQNYGFAKANNIAVEKCQAEYIATLNPDCLLLNDVFTRAVKYFEKHTGVGIIGPKIYNVDGSVQGSARRFPSVWSYAFGRKSPLTQFFPNNRLTKREFFGCNDQQQSGIDVDWVSGACMIIRRATYEAIGGFDDRFFLYWEDADLCRRIKEKGWLVLYYPKCEVTHIVGMSSRSRPFRSIFYFHQSCYRLVAKHSGLAIKLLLPVIGLALAFRCLFVMKFNFVSGKVNANRHRLSKSWSKRAGTKKRDAKIKVLRIVSRMNIGGPSIHVSLLTKKIDPMKFDTRLVAGALSACEGDMSYLMQGSSGRLRRIPELQREIHPLKDVVVLLKLFHMIRTEKPHIVHTHTAKAGTLGRVAACAYQFLTGRKIALVHTFHGNVLERYFGPFKSRFFEAIERCLALFTDAIIAISPTQKWELVTKYKISRPEKIHIINLGFDLSAFINADGYKKGAFRNKWTLNGSTTLIGIVGRIVPIKNHHMFLDAAKSFLEHYHPTAVKFVIVGDGEQRNVVEQYANKLGLADYVLFCGWENDISKVYADLDILALTSFNEGTPVSIIEAMAASVPVISTEVGGIKDLLGEPVSDATVSNGFKVCRRGIICKSDDVIAFSKGIRYLIDNALDKKSPRIQKARDYVLENYSEKALINNIEQLYDHLLAN